MFPHNRSTPAPPLPHVRGSPALRVLPAGPTSRTTSGSLRFIALSVAVLGYPKMERDLPGSLTPPFPTPPCSPTPPGSPAASPLAAAYYSLPEHKSLSAPGLRLHEAQSLHLRYGWVVALPTLSRWRCRPPAQGSIPGGWLALAEAGISPAGGARLHLARLVHVQGCTTLIQNFHRSHPPVLRQRNAPELLESPPRALRRQTVPPRGRSGSDSPSGSRHQ